MRRKLTSEEKDDDVRRLAELYEQSAELERRMREANEEIIQLQDRLLHGAPLAETIAWYQLYRRLRWRGTTVRVLFQPPGGELPAMEWVASTTGLNRYAAAGENTATWHPDSYDSMQIVDEPAEATGGEPT